MALEVGHWHGLSTACLLQSLPSEVALVTVDHHRGDDHVAAVRSEDFLANVAGYVRGRDFEPVFVDYREALTWYWGPWSFVFYDAAHSEEDCNRFWSMVRRCLSPGCIVCWDDADWREMSDLGTLCENDGLEDVTRLPIKRLSGDKSNKDTYTLRVMRCPS